MSSGLRFGTAQSDLSRVASPSYSAARARARSDWSKGSSCSANTPGKFASWRACVYSCAKVMLSDPDDPVGPGHDVERRSSGR